MVTVVETFGIVGKLLGDFWKRLETSWNLLKTVGNVLETSVALSMVVLPLLLIECPYNVLQIIL